MRPALSGATLYLFRPRCQTLQKRMFLTLFDWFCASSNGPASAVYPLIKPRTPLDALTIPLEW